MAEKIERCACGRHAEMSECVKMLVAGMWYYDALQVVCLDWNCWRGPIRKTERGAIAAWNRIMWNMRKGER